MNTHRKKELLKSVIYNRNCKMYMVASSACEVTEILSQRSTEEAV